MKMLTKQILTRLRTGGFIKRSVSQQATKFEELPELRYKGQVLQFDELTNINPHIIKHLGRTGNPLFSVYDSLSPIVTTEQNFDSLLVPKEHPSYSSTDCYFINSGHLLRAHTTAHQAELVGSGLNNFLIVGDVYRRDEIDRTHYPVFHQLDAVRLQTQYEVFPEESKLSIFEKKTDKRTSDKQEVHTVDATQVVEHHLKSVLQGLAIHLFGPGVKYRWVDAYFPFTHPSWELEIKHDDEWLELLGCGIMEHQILARAGATDRIGWAFGLGLERLAMHIYQIPDIRLFWSSDSGFLSQFKVDDPNTPIQYKAVSVFPQCPNDMSFWLPNDTKFCSNDFYDLVRDVGGDLVEQVYLIDEFFHAKKQMKSHCYRLVYRHMERTLTQNEVNAIHKMISDAASERLNVVIRA